MMKQGQPCLCHSAIYHNSFFANPEGRSFQCFIPMPFKKGARIQITNESGKRLSHIFYDINFDKITVWNNDYLYFHNYWNRDTATTLAKDFELLPAVKGKGRFLGVNIGVNTNPVYKDHWWGEGEVGTAWEQGVFYNDYAGCLLANKDTAGWAFCRYHVPDPIYFKSGCSITLQQIGGNGKEKVIELQHSKVPMIPVAIDDLTKIHLLYKKDSLVQLDTQGLPGGFANLYRSDDVSSTAYFISTARAVNFPHFLFQ